MLELWEKRRVQFEQCMELQLFNRDCEHANATMTKQEVGSCPLLSDQKADVQCYFADDLVSAVEPPINCGHRQDQNKVSA